MEQQPMNQNEQSIVELIYYIIGLIVIAPITFLLQMVRGNILDSNVDTSHPKTDIQTLSNSLSETIQGMFSLFQILMTVITLFLFISILLKIHARFNSKAKSETEISNKTNTNNQNSSTTKEDNGNKEKSNLSIKLDLPNSTIYRPNVDKILSMIQYIDDLQKQIENSSNVNNKKQASPLSLQLNQIDKSIFIKFNVLQEKFISDYQSVDWNKNINQEISNSYQKIYDEHEKLLKEQYYYIKQYLKEYFNQQVVQSKEELDVINKIIN